MFPLQGWLHQAYCLVHATWLAMKVCELIWLLSQNEYVFCLAINVPAAKGGLCFAPEPSPYPVQTAYEMADA